MTIEQKIRGVIDRVLWTAGASEWNKTQLAQAIAEELQHDRVSDTVHGLSAFGEQAELRYLVDKE